MVCMLFLLYMYSGIGLAYMRLSAGIPPYLVAVTQNLVNHFYSPGLKFCRDSDRGYTFFLFEEDYYVN